MHNTIVNNSATNIFCQYFIHYSYISLCVVMAYVVLYLFLRLDDLMSFTIPNDNSRVYERDAYYALIF